MIKDEGGIWIVYPKGNAELTEREVLTSVRFVIPVAQRKKKK